MFSGQNDKRSVSLWIPWTCICRRGQMELPIQIRECSPVESASGELESCLLVGEASFYPVPVGLGLPDAYLARLPPQCTAAQVDLPANMDTRGSQ
ncbi:uncharacterized protein LOC143439313 isoform X2 [Arvicanthis niloticus]|uniref:uncharacterized protein LOC143310766 isoform X2 n=1 Tax=Arvicanthis niloticus TaxID=61156 RepID=UPI00402B9BBB